jgi:hypothetical protein
MVKVETGILATLELRELITVTGSGGVFPPANTEEAKVLELICFTRSSVGGFAPSMLSSAMPPGWGGSERGWR